MLHICIFSGANATCCNIISLDLTKFIVRTEHDWQGFASVIARNNFTVFTRYLICWIRISKFVNKDLGKRGMTFLGIS